MSENSAREPRTQRNVRTEAGQVLAQLAAMYNSWGSVERSFWEDIFRPLADDPEISGDEKNKALFELAELRGEISVPADVASPPIEVGGVLQLAFMQISCAYAIQAIKAEELSPQAWSYVCDAYHWLGLLQGSASGTMLGAGVGLSMQAAKGAKGRDGKYQPLREFALQAVTKRSYPSARNAAINLKDDILQLASQLGIYISEQQAQSTIASWLKDVPFASKRAR